MRLKHARENVITQIRTEIGETRHENKIKYKALHKKTKTSNNKER